MILITGGLGFIGAHTGRALLDLGEPVFLTQRRRTRVPDFLDAEQAGRVVVEALDVTDRPALLAIRGRHPITRILHLASPGHGILDPVQRLRAETSGLLNMLQAGREWGVSRVGIASTIGVYAGLPQVPYSEDLPLPVDQTLPIPLIKQAAELFTSLVADQTGMDVINLRISTVWGPLIRNLGPVVPRLVHAAVHHQPLSDPLPYADHAADLCYVKDCARGIALVMLADRLKHRTYNVGHGAPTAVRTIATALTALIPDALIQLRPGDDPDGPNQSTWLDITRIRDDTGYEPQYSTEHGLHEYVAWLQAGNDY